MGYIRRQKSGKVLAGSKLVVPGKGILMVNPGGNTDINQKKGNSNNNTIN